MRIGTWNLDAQWSQRHCGFLNSQSCDLWLLTEVPPELRHRDGEIASFYSYLSAGRMTRGQHYSAILSSAPLTIESCGHAASVAASRDELVFCSTVFPWAGCRVSPSHIWIGDSLEQMTQNAIDELYDVLRKHNTVWGGDWNQNLFGDWQHVGSAGMRNVIENAVSELELIVPTARLLHRNESSFTIDQIAVPSGCVVHRKTRIDATGLSDHDAYTLNVELL